MRFAYASAWFDGSTLIGWVKQVSSERKRIRTMNHILNHWFKPFDDNLIQPAVETLNYKQSVGQQKKSTLKSVYPL